MKYSIEMVGISFIFFFNLYAHITFSRNALLQRMSLPKWLAEKKNRCRKRVEQTKKNIETWRKTSTIDYVYSRWKLKTPQRSSGERSPVGEEKGRGEVRVWNKIFSEIDVNKKSSIYFYVILSN